MSSATLRCLLLAMLMAVMPGCKKVPPPEFMPEEINWPPPPDPAVVTWTGHIARSTWAASPTKLQTMVAQLTGKEEAYTFRKPYGVTVDDSGRVFVSDTGWGLVLVFDKAGESFSFLGQSGQGALQKPAGMDTDSRGSIFVADLQQGLIFEYDKSLEFVRTYGGGKLTRPVGVAIDEERREMWVTDSKQHSVEIFSLDGTHIKTIGGRGSNDGRFNFPTNVVLAKSGRVYVADTFNFRVQVFTREGEFIQKWGKNCDQFGCFARAKGIAVDEDEHIYVVDAAFNNVQVFSHDGKLLLFFGGVGNGPGQLWLPSGIHITDDGKIFVVSQYNWRVNMYQYNGVPDPDDEE